MRNFSTQTCGRAGCSECSHGMCLPSTALESAEEGAAGKAMLLDSSVHTRSFGPELILASTETA